MPSDKIYYIDGQPVIWFALIDVAKGLGYVENDGLYSTSRAAAFMRELGHSVSERKPKGETHEISSDR